MNASSLKQGLLVLALAGLPLIGRSASFTVNPGPPDNTAKTLNTNGDVGTILPGGTLSISGSTVAVTMTGTGTLTLINSGNLLQTGTGRGVDSNNGASAIRLITNTETGLIQTTNADTIRINIATQRVTLNNSGAIISVNTGAAGNQALDFNAIGAAGFNLINNFSTGLIQATAADAIRPGVNGVVNNWGTIAALPAVELTAGQRLVSGSDAVDAQQNTGITINNWGTIAGRHGITGEDGGSGFAITVNNFAGTISGVNGSGVNIDDFTSRAIINNAGAIIGNFDSTRFDVGDGDGVDVDGLVTIINSGIIRGIGAGGLNDGALNNSEGISIGGGTIINLAGGEITGENNTGTESKGNGILVDDSAAGNALAATTIINSGLIHGKSGFGVKIIGNFADTIVNNSGGIIRGGGSAAALQTDGGNDTVINAGSIIGDKGQAVDLGEGDDTLIILGPRALIRGDANGNFGTDSLVINPGPGGVFTMNGSILSFENVEFISGTTILGAGSASVLTSSISLSSASLIVNGFLQVPSVIISGNGLLGGNGTVAGNVVNGGTVSPGNSIGKLTIAGNYTQTSHGTLLIEVSGPHSYDRLVVTGTARLGGTLQVVALSNDMSFGDQYALLKAGKITGRFSRIEMPNPSIFRGRFLVEGHSGILLVAPASYTLVAQTANQVRVARALDQWIGREDGDIGEVTLALDLLHAEEYPAAFEAIMPGYYAGALRTGIALSQNHGQLLHQQLSARRLGERTVTAGPAVVSGASTGGKGSKDVQKVAAPIQPPTDEFRWNAWMQGSGLFSSGGLSLTPGEDFDSGTFLLGADVAVSEHLALGVFASYQEGWGDYDNGGETNLDSVRAGLYATVDYGGLYMNAAVGGGSTDYSIHRPLTWGTLDRTARSDPNAAEFFTLAGAGYDFHAGNFTVGPQFSAQYTRLEMDGTTETGAGVLNLAVDDTTSESFRTYLGGRLAYTIQANENVAIIPELRVFWQHEFLQDDENIHAALNGGSGPGFDFQSSNDDEDAVYVGAGVGIQVGPRFYMNAYYNADFGRGDDGNHTVSVSASIKF